MDNLSPVVRGLSLLHNDLSILRERLHSFGGYLILMYLLYCVAQVERSWRSSATSRKLDSKLRALLTDTTDWFLIYDTRFRMLPNGSFEVCDTEGFRLFGTEKAFNRSLSKRLRRQGYEVDDEEIKQLISAAGLQRKRPPLIEASDPGIQ